MLYLTRDYYDGFINDRLKYGSGKYGEIAQNPPHFPGRHFTGVQPFSHC